MTGPTRQLIGGLLVLATIAALIVGYAVSH